MYLGLLGFQKLFKKKAHSTKFNNLVKTIYQKKINMAFASAFGGGVLAFFFCALEDWRWNETWGWYMFYFFYVSVYLMLPLLERKALIKMSEEINYDSIENLMKTSKLSGVKLIRDDIESFIGRKLNFFENNAFQKWYDNTTTQHPIH